MAKEKKVNYTDEMVATMTEMYTGVDNKAEVKAISKAIDKSEGSVRSKLSNMKLYVTAEKVEAKTKGQTKADVVAAIATRVGGLTDQEQEGLIKATASPLGKILDALTVETETEVE